MVYIMMAYQRPTFHTPSSCKYKQFPTENKIFLRPIGILDHIWWCWHNAKVFLSFGQNYHIIQAFHYYLWMFSQVSELIIDYDLKSAARKRVREAFWNFKTFSYSCYLPSFQHPTQVLLKPNLILPALLGAQAKGHCCQNKMWQKSKRLSSAKNSELGFSLYFESPRSTWNVVKCSC